MVQATATDNLTKTPDELAQEIYDAWGLEEGDMVTVSVLPPPQIGSVGSPPVITPAGPPPPA
jgi:hypothetical protein